MPDTTLYCSHQNQVQCLETCLVMDRQRLSCIVKQSEWEKQTSYSIIYMWNLEKQCRWTCLQSRNRDKGVESGRVYTKAGRGGWVDGEAGICTTDTMSVKQVTSETLLCSTRNSTQCSAVAWWEGNPKQRGHTYSTKKWLKKTLWKNYQQLLQVDTSQALQTCQLRFSFTQSIGSNF